MPVAIWKITSFTCTWFRELVFGVREWPCFPGAFVDDDGQHEFTRKVREPGRHSEPLFMAGHRQARARNVTIVTTMNLDRLQIHRKWEISG